MNTQKALADMYRVRGYGHIPQSIQYFFSDAYKVAEEKKNYKSLVSAISSPKSRPLEARLVRRMSKGYFNG